MTPPLTKLATVVLTQFLEDLEKGFTINELSRRTGKSYANTHKTVNDLLEQDILTREVIGHSHYCRLNLQNDNTLLYLSILHHDKKEKLLLKNQSLGSVVKRLKEKEGVVLVWKRKTDVLAIVEDKNALKSSTLVKTITLDEFTEDKNLFTTIGSGVLLSGHVRYPELLRRIFR